ncbi:ENTH-domain-containing protein [Wolfiporia cocos MD-104 SS10]|uniref:ENTH-domain-containing protein n=1 Tax=Wolfiporia cocos (strain MD-104) TaxID=742152 RepID=A0A2H3IY19_WOLCO|nr:ENTH-domain-containing protein [Wolfiporia cocos MD-104 SS10]
MSTMQHFGKGVMRVAKNYTKGYSDVQAKVRDATSNDPWGPSGTQMNELAQLSYNQNDFIEIMEMLDKRLNDKGKNWRHVFKSLTVLDYLLHAGSENVVLYFRDNIYVIKTLKEFQYIDEEGRDQGANVRQKAKDITNLLQDEALLRQQRRSRANMRDRMVGGRKIEGDDFNVGDDENAQRRSHSLPARRRTDGDAELQRAIEESKRSLAEEEARKGMMTAEERDIAQAIKLSEEEEAKRAKAIADSNQAALFDDHNQLVSTATANTNNPFPLVDVSGGLQPQFTVQPQFTSFNPYQQQMQQEAMQAEYMRQQQEWMQQQQQLQAQQAAQMQQAQQEEWMRQQQLLAMQQQQQQQMLMAQPTGFGSNNPFAPAGPQTNSVSASPFSQPLTQSPAPQSTAPVFNLQGTYANGGPASSPPPQPPQPSRSAPPQQSPVQAKTRADDQHAHLANLLANRDEGIDTFGNFGQLRFGQQAGRLTGQPTGQSHNPFQQQQQQQQQSEQPFFSI